MTFVSLFLATTETLGKNKRFYYDICVVVLLFYDELAIFTTI